ncbi:MAG: hypothetical protein WCO04_14615 [Pseudomonadota bacterium]
MTKSTYKVIENEGLTSYIERTDADGKVWSIPMDEANSDYQRYLNSEAEQSTPSVTRGE